MKVQTVVSKVQTALAGTNSNQGQLQAKCKTSLNPKGRTIPRHSVLEVLCSRVLSEIGKKKPNSKLKTCTWVHMHFLSAAIGKPNPWTWRYSEHVVIYVIYVTAQSPLVWQIGSGSTQLLFVQWILNTWWSALPKGTSPYGGGFPPILQGSKGFCLFPTLAFHFLSQAEISDTTHRYLS